MIDGTARVARSKKRLQLEGGKRTSVNLTAVDIERLSIIAGCIEAQSQQHAIVYAIAFTARRLLRTKRRSSTQNV